MLKSVDLCKFMVWCTDVLADKPHPRFDAKILSKKMRLIHRCLQYFIINHTLRTKGYIHKSVHPGSLNCSIAPFFWSLLAKYLTFFKLNKTEIIRDAFGCYRKQCPKEYTEPSSYNIKWCKPFQKDTLKAAWSCNARKAPGQ